MIAKLRRGESFTFAWEKSADLGSGRTTIWMHPSLFCEFVFSGSKRIPLNRVWIESLMNRANSAGGLELVSESAGDRVSS